MPNPTHSANDDQIAADAANGAGLFVAPEKIKFLNPLFDKTTTIFLANYDAAAHYDAAAQIAKRHSPREFLPQKLLEGEEPTAEQPQDVQAAENRHGKLEYDTCLPARVMRFAGTVVGFVVGGLAGAALGSLVAALAENIVAEQSNNIWLKLKLIGPWRVRCTSNDDGASSADVDRPWQDG